MEKEAILWRSLKAKKVECFTCARRCQIPDQSNGFCFVRHNINGKLYTTNYGRPEVMQLDPIEKKPFNHFMPGSKVFSIGTTSCNLACTFCQNPDLSKTHAANNEYVPPEGIIEFTKASKADGIAYTYNEPTIFLEYALDIAKLAHKNKLYNVFVTNGYMTRETVQAMKGLIDAVVVDFKGNGARSFVSKYSAIPSDEPIKEALLEMKKARMHIEITDLIIPSVGDSSAECAALAAWIHDNLGPDTPMHFTRFHPDYKMLDYPETPYATLKHHYDNAKKAGINYVYIGNTQTSQYENTYCPKCGDIVIKREGLCLTQWNISKGNKCASCHNIIPIVGPPPKDQQ